MDQVLNDGQLFPLLDARGRALLRRLREHPHAPTYNYRTGDRLTAASLTRVRAFADDLVAQRSGWQFGTVPPWLPPFLAACRSNVPFYRSQPSWSQQLCELPILTRAQLRCQSWEFVPDSADLSDLVTYSTSGTSGTALRLPACPEVPSRYLPLMQLALAAYGVRLEGGDRVSIVQACAQKVTYSLVSISSYLNGAAFVKANLLPSTWRHPDDRVRFLDDCNPEIYTGDPFAFSQLMQLPLRTRPKALISAAAALLPGLRRRLESHFGCPVIDLYSMNEAGPIAFSRECGHEILPHNLYVEILDEHGQTCPPGVQGQIVLTGGINPVLPLVRYATGDYAALDDGNVYPRLVGLQGRAPVIFRNDAGERLNSVDVSIALKDLPLAWFRLHQRSDGTLHMEADCNDDLATGIEKALQALFGPGIPLIINKPAQPVPEGKPIHYGSDIDL